jgi:hypothetical protein
LLRSIWTGLEVTGELTVCSGCRRRGPFAPRLLTEHCEGSADVI